MAAPREERGEEREKGGRRGERRKGKKRRGERGEREGREESSGERVGGVRRKNGQRGKDALSIHSHYAVASSQHLG